MSKPDSLSSRELGLLLAQQLFDVEDLHYGLWEADLEVVPGNLVKAQQRYTDHLLAVIDECLAARPDARILDVGCGSGHVLAQLAARGYRVDAVNPSTALNRLVRERLQRQGLDTTRLFETGFESLPPAAFEQSYDLLLFSESFQYVTLPGFFAIAPRLLAAGGHVLLCDFYKTAAHGDGQPGDRSFSGGHVLAQFEEQLAASPFACLLIEDLTPLVSPNIRLIDEWIKRRGHPALCTLDAYFDGRYPRLYSVLKRLFRKRLERLRYKYLSGHRSQAVFEKYKTYRLNLLQLQDSPAEPGGGL